MVEDADRSETRRRAVRTERAKLPATDINGLAIAVFAVGGLPPFMLSLSPGGVTPAAWGVGCLAVCSAFSAALHSMARFTLGGMEP